MCWLLAVILLAGKKVLGQQGGSKWECVHSSCLQFCEQSVVLKELIGDP